MVVKILKKFHDRVDYSKVYLVGETFTFEDARAEALIARGLAESAEEPLKPESEPEVELVLKVAEEPIKPVSKVQPIVKQAKKKAPKVN